MAVMDVVGVKPGRVAEASGGRFVTFEGPEGAGKTTQIARLRARLESNGQSVLVTREPGGTPLGGALRSLMLDTGQIPLAPIAQALLMSADRAQHVASVTDTSIRCTPTRDLATVSIWHHSRQSRFLRPMACSPT